MPVHQTAYDIVMAAIQTHEVEAIVHPDGTVRIDAVPFPVGNRLRVILSAAAPVPPHRHSAEEFERSRQIRSELKGSVTRYDDPFGPAIPESDWDALR